MPAKTKSRRLPGNAGLRTRSSAQSASLDSRDPTEPRGWHSRGYLPHFDSNDVVQHVTFHLIDSLPKETVERLAAELHNLEPERRSIEKSRRLQDLIDAGHGARWLRRADCAQVVQDALLHFDGERCRMIAWVVMPNHVHALFQTLNGWGMDSLVGSWKTFTANAIGRIVRQPGAPMPSVWHSEYWDRFIRNGTHLASVLDYIHDNPVKAGLAARPEDWPWSSAYPGNAGLRTRPSAQSASPEPRAPSKGAS